MIQYGLNIIICSGLLFLLYKVLLENEKMHVFKRFYLLFSVLLSLIAPLITISFSSAPDHNIALQYLSKEPVDFIISEPLAPVKDDKNVMLLLPIIIYLLGLALALFRFFKKLSCFIIKTTKNEQLLFSQARLVLVDKEIIPHSFLNKIFLSASAYKNNKIESEIIAHELAHVKQQHSLDILFTRLIQCFYWFNPFFIFYARAIQLNHEFLADEAVVRSSKDPVSYQYLLINSPSMKSHFSLASQFNYSIIKKRLVMIARTTSRQKLVIKALVAICLFAGAGLLFASKETAAQVATPPIQKKEVPSTKEGASPQMINEYEAIVDRYRVADAQGSTRFKDFPNLSEPEKKRLWEIYQMMTKEQQEKQELGFRPKPPIMQKIYPTNVQLKEWVDAKKYFVRINGYRVKNSQLNNYQASDFNYYEFYKPNKGSTDYGKYYAQVNLITKESYAKYVEYWEKEPPFLLVVFVQRHQTNQVQK
jgi:beta-lactamase regulating signal transducer with metallopeptidase domain